MHLDEDGSVWVAADQGISLVRADGVVRSFSAEEGLPHPAAGAVARDENGVLWAGTLRGLALFQEDRWVEVPVAGLTGLQVAALHLTPRGLLLGTSQGLIFKEGDRFETLPLDEEPLFVRNITTGPDGVIWAESQGMIFRFQNGESLRYTPENGIPDSEIWTVMADREGNIWIGSNLGLYKLVPGALALFTDAQDLPHPFVRAMALDSVDGIWMGTRDGLAFWDGKDMKDVSFRSEVRDPRIYSLSLEPGGGLLAGTPSGLVHRSDSGFFRILTQEEGLPHNQVMGLHPDGEGGVWVCTLSGVVRWLEWEILPPPPRHLESLVLYFGHWAYRACTGSSTNTRASFSLLRNPEGARQWKYTSRRLGSEDR